MKSGFDEIQKNLSPYYVNHIILVTDGHTYGDESDCLELSKRAAERNIGISCFGIGGKWNDSFLETLASTTGGGCTYIKDPKDIRTYLGEKLNALNQVLIEGLTFNFREGPGVNLNYAFRLEPEANVLPLTSPIRLGNIPRNHRLRLIFEFMILPIKFKAIGQKSNIFTFLQQLVSSNINIGFSKISLIAKEIDLSNPDFTLLLNIGLYRMI